MSPFFLSPWMLWGLGAPALLALIHLRRRRRVAQHPFGTLRFLRIAAAQTARRARIETVRPFILRCLLTTLLVLALARPVCPAKDARFLGVEIPRPVIHAIETVDGLAGLKRRPDQGHGAVPLWPLPLLLAAPVLAAELLLSRMRTRRDARGKAVSIRTGRLNKRRPGA